MNFFFFPILSPARNAYPKLDKKGNSSGVPATRFAPPLGDCIVNLSMVRMGVPRHPDSIRLLCAYALSASIGMVVLGILFSL